MPLIAYALGLNIVAAASPEEAVAVMDRHEGPGRWLLDDVRELTEEERFTPVDDSTHETIAEAVARCEAAPRSRRSPALEAGHLIRWDYPTA